MPLETLFITSLLLVPSGDTELNPCQTEMQNDASVSSLASDNIKEADIMNNFSFSTVHYNIESVLNKVSLIRTELKHFDIICLKETWLNQGVSDDSTL